MSIKLTDNRVAVASNGESAVAVVLIGHQVAVLRYAPSSIGAWSNRDQFASLYKKAKAKLTNRYTINA